MEILLNYSSMYPHECSTKIHTLNPDVLDVLYANHSLKSSLKAVGVRTRAWESKISFWGSSRIFRQRSCNEAGVPKLLGTE